MKKKIDQKIDEHNPWDGDVLGRESTGTYLTRLLYDIKNPFVISIKSPFGTGKTDFLKRWKNHLKNEDFPAVVYFNAWETDFSDDPLIAFIDAIRSELEDEQEKIDKYAEWAKIAGDYLGRKLLPALAQGAAAKVLSNTAADKLFSKEIDQQISDVMGEVAAESLSRHSKAQDSITAFKNFLEGVVKENSKKADNNQEKLIILVDELDRCRPNYAIELLECIKHLFNVPGVIFVIAVDDEQLNGSVATVYGQKLDGEKYLRKFFNWQFNLPKPSAEQYTRFLIEYFQISEKFIDDTNAVGAFNTDAFGQPKIHEAVNSTLSGRENFIRTFSLCSEIFGLTLREQEQCFTNIELVVRTLGQSQVLLSEALAFLAVIHTKVSRENFFKICFRHIKRNEQENPELEIEKIINSLKNRDLVRQLFLHRDDYNFFSSTIFDEKKALKNNSENLNRQAYSVQTQSELCLCVYKQGIQKKYAEILEQEGKSRISEVIYQRLEEAVQYTENPKTEAEAA